MEEKYAEALRLYCTTSLSAARLAAQHGKIRRYGSTTESMKSIARYLGLNYVALNGFIRCNFPNRSSGTTKHRGGTSRREPEAGFGA